MLSNLKLPLQLSRKNFPVAHALKHSGLAFRFASTEALRLPLLNPFDALQLTTEDLEHVCVETFIDSVVLGPVAKTLVGQLEKAEMVLDERCSVDTRLVCLSVVVLINRNSILFQNGGSGILIIVVFLGALA